MTARRLAGREPAKRSDAELARAVAMSAGAPDHDAEAELCRRYVGRLIAFGRRRLPSEDDARDLAQDALLLTLEKLRRGEVRDAERIGSFLFGVARNLVVTRHRERSRTQTFDPTDRELVAESFELPDPLARERVGACLEDLPDRQRTVVLLSFYAERSSREIASTLDISHGNVRVLRHRGVAGLRDCLGGRFGVEGSLS